MTSELNGLTRCKCARLPEVKIEDNGAAGYVVELFCAEHGWRALGDSLEQAKEHWNRFAAFMLKQVA